MRSSIPVSLVFDFVRGKNEIELKMVLYGKILISIIITMMLNGQDNGSD